MADETKTELLAMAAEIVASYVANNTVAAAELPALIKSVHGALGTVGAPVVEAPAALTPAVSIRRSIGDDFLICLDDGRKFKSLKRHLRTKYNMSPEDYRAKWGLPKDYPMVAPAYAASRSALAKQMGLGQGGRKPAAPAKAGRKPRSANAGAAAGTTSKRGGTTADA